ncbi:MAG: hypothetical protein WC146_02665 [Patescibacteria group bacterium]|jgi:flagellar basal body-associated protein FliL
MPEEPKVKFRFLKGFLRVILIVVITLILLAGALLAYVVVKKPFGITLGTIGNIGSDVPSDYDHPLLDDSQEKTLQSLGVDLKTVPSAISPEQEACAVQYLGQERVNEIKAGATPSVSDYLKAKDCF